MSITNEQGPLRKATEGIPAEPWALQKMLEHIKVYYGNPPVMIHENGTLLHFLSFWFVTSQSKNVLTVTTFFFFYIKKFHNKLLVQNNYSLCAALNFLSHHMVFFIFIP